MPTTIRSKSLIHACDGERALRTMPFIACLSLAICVNFLFMAWNNRERIAEVLVLAGVGIFAFVFWSRACAGMFTSAAGRALAAFFILGAGNVMSLAAQRRTCRSAPHVPL